MALVAFPVLAAEQRGIHDPGTGLDDPEIKERALEVEENNDMLIAPTPKLYGNQGNGQGNQVQNQNREQVAEEVRNQEEDSRSKTAVAVKAKNITELKEMINQKKQEMEQELESLGNATKQKVFKNQNQVREAVHALLASEDLVGGIGQQVSAIAREFNNSVEKTIQAEEKMQVRSKVKSFFFGGDKEAAQELEQETEQNRNRIQELKQLEENCSCGQEVMAVIQEQVQNMEQEQNRLEQLAQEQINKKGVIGWLFGWLKK